MHSEPPAPFRRIGPARPVCPLVVAVPHAGRRYPAALLAESAVPQEVLEQLEDRHADRLVEQIATTGAVVIVAEVARAWIDLNRAPEDVEPSGGSGTAAMSPRARSGLGLVPSRLNGRPLLARSPGMDEVARRLAAVHEPYHRAVGDALAAAAGLHGRALLVDLHSMPPLKGAAAAQVVVGDLHGRSADPAVVRAALDTPRAHGFRVALNRPYAGAYTLARHADRPRIDAVQVEVDRAAYLNGDLRDPTAQAGRVASMLRALCLSALQAQRPPAIAAE